MKLPNKLKILCVASSISVLAAGTSQAAVLVSLDLTTLNQVTVNATNGLSAATIQGNPRLFLQNFFTSAGAAFNTPAASATGGSFTNIVSGDASNGSIRLLRGTGVDEASGGGLGIFNWTGSSIADVTNGQQAFTGSTTVNLTAGDYTTLLAGNSTGNLYFPAVVSADVGSAALIGEYEVIKSAVPEPTTTALSFLSIGALLLRRKRS